MAVAVPRRPRHRPSPERDPVDLRQRGLGARWRVPLPSRAEYARRSSGMTAALARPSRPSPPSRSPASETRSASSRSPRGRRSWTSGAVRDGPPPGGERSRASRARHRSGHDGRDAPQGAGGGGGGGARQRRNAAWRRPRPADRERLRRLRHLERRAEPRARQAARLLGGPADPPPGWSLPLCGHRRSRRSCRNPYGETSTCGPVESAALCRRQSSCGCSRTSDSGPSRFVSGSIRSRARRRRRWRASIASTGVNVHAAKRQA